MGGVHKTYSSALSKQKQLDECRQLQQEFLLQFHKTVVWYCSWKEMPAMLADIMQIIMLETTEPSRMKMYEEYNYLYITHTVGLATVSFTVLRNFEHRFFLPRIKKLAVLVCQTENFSNFIIGEHSGKVLLYYWLQPKVATFIDILLILNELILIQINFLISNSR